METMRRLLLCLWFVALAASPLSAQRIGGPAPPFQVEKYVRGPEKKPKWEDLRGQAVVLEFWATWCGPCVQAIPHMNRLVDLFANQPVRFISVTREKEKTVRRFLEKKPMHGWVALDRDRSLLEDYGVRGYPTVVLIDAAGIVRGVTHPNRLNAEVVGRLVTGRFDDAPDADTRALQEAVAEGVRRSEATEAFVSEGDDGSAQMIGLTVMEAVKALWGVSEKRVVPHIAVGEARFDISRPSGDLAIIGPTLQRALEDTARFEAEWREEERWVYVLKLPEGVKAKDFKKRLAKAEGGERRYRGWDGSLLSAASFAGLAAFLEEKLDLPVVDATGIDGEFELTLQWDPSGQWVGAAIAAQLGLELADEKRRILMLVLEEW